MASLGGDVTFLLSIVFSLSAWAQLSVCANYQVEGVHPDDVRVPQVIKCMRQGDTLYLDGAIDENLIYELHTFNSEPIRKIHLNSPGGRVEDAFELAEFIRNQGITTLLRAGAKCMSACTLLYQAGVKRIAHPDSVFMYHSARYPFQSKATLELVKSCQSHPDKTCVSFIQDKTQSLEKITDDLFSLYVDYGASPQLYEDYLKLNEVDNWIEKGNYLKIEDWYMTAQEAAAYGVVTNLLNNFHL